MFTIGDTFTTLHFASVACEALKAQGVACRVSLVSLGEAQRTGRAFKVIAT